MADREYEVGIRELKAHASEIVREVREAQVRYVVTHRGRPVGLLVPFPEGGRDRFEGGHDASVWQELERLGQEIARGWKSEKDSTELLSQMRR